MNVLEIHQLHKSFGSRAVISGLNLTVPEHSIYGFLDPNGSGKTTTMKMIAGLLRPSGGDLLVCGEKVTYGETKTNRHIGYLPDVPEFYGYMKPMEYLRLCGRIAGLSESQIRVKSEELLRLVGLAGVNRRIGGFSRGMKQRLGIAQALLGEPRLFICDEPTSALDPIGRSDILDVLLSIKGTTTVVLSTHILSDAERVCDHIGILHNGKLALSGTLAEIKAARRQNGFIIEFSNRDELSRFAACDELNRPFIKLPQETRTLAVTITDNRVDGSFLISLLAREQVIPLKFEVMEPTLEHLFTGAIK